MMNEGYMNYFLDSSDKGYRLFFEQVEDPKTGALIELCVVTDEDGKNRQVVDCQSYTVGADFTYSSWCQLKEESKKFKEEMEHIVE